MEWREPGAAGLDSQGTVDGLCFALQSSLKQQRGQSGPEEDKDGALGQETRESPG